MTQELDVRNDDGFARNQRKTAPTAAVEADTDLA